METLFKDNYSKTSSDKRAKKAEKLAALEKDFASNLRLKKIEFELKRKELEMEMQLFEEEGALKLEYEKEVLDARAPESDDSATPSIRSRSPFNWKTPKDKDVSVWLDNSDKFSNGHQVESVPAQPGNKTKLSVINQAVVVSYLS